MTTIKIIGAAWTATQKDEPPEEGEFVFVSDPNCTSYDWLAVYDEFPRRKKNALVRNGKFPLACPQTNTILLTLEPTSVKFYNRVYTGQFGHLLTNRPYEAERHHHYHFGRGYYAWFIDRSYPTVRSLPSPEKTKCISAVYSAKNMRHTLHHARNELLDYLVANVKGLDRFGKGVRPITHKEDALDAYKYHLAIENHVAPGHWSEKIEDAILCECLPFYAGDPELGEILPPESFIPIPIADPPAAARIVNDAIAAGEYEKRRPFILEAKRIILEKYNFRSQIIEVVRAAKNDKRPFPKNFERGYLLTRKRTRLTLRGALGDLLHHIERIFDRKQVSQWQNVP